MRNSLFYYKFDKTGYYIIDFEQISSEIMEIQHKTDLNVIVRYVQGTISKIDAKISSATSNKTKEWEIELNNNGFIVSGSNIRLAVTNNCQCYIELWIVEPQICPHVVFGISNLTQASLSLIGMGEKESICIAGPSYQIYKPIFPIMSYFGSLSNSMEVSIYSEEAIRVNIPDTTCLYDFCKYEINSNILMQYKQIAPVQQVKISLELEGIDPGYYNKSYIFPLPYYNLSGQFLFGNFSNSIILPILHPMTTTENTAFIAMIVLSIAMLIFIIVRAVIIISFCKIDIAPTIKSYTTNELESTPRQMICLNTYCPETSAQFVLPGYTNYQNA